MPNTAAVLRPVAGHAGSYVGLEGSVFRPFHGRLRRATQKGSGRTAVVSLPGPNGQYRYHRVRDLVAAAFPEGGRSRRLTMTELRPVPGWPYFADDEGNIYSAHVAGGGLRRLRGVESGRGYLQVTLSDGPRITKAYSHRLVYSAWVGSPAGKVIRHKNHSRGDNCPRNLVGGTIRDNALDACRSGAAAKALNPAVVRSIRRRAARGETCVALAHVYRVNPKTVWRVVNRRSWTWLSDDLRRKAA